MGCDIHSRAEVRRDGVWEAVGRVFPNDEWDRQYYGEFGEAPFDRRDYRVFGRLAGVRDDSVEPLQQRRGVPPDVSPPVKALVDDWEPDGHSHGWLTLRELREARVDSEQFASHLAVLETLGPPDDVRVVFFFDN